MNEFHKPPVDVAAIARFLVDLEIPNIDPGRLTVDYLKLRYSGPVLALLQVPRQSGGTLALTARWVGQAKGARLVERLNSHHRRCYRRGTGVSLQHGLDQVAFHAPDLGMVLIAFPYDRRLLTLPLVADERCLQGRLETALGPEIGNNVDTINGMNPINAINAINVQPVRYKPEGKCVLRIELGWADESQDLPTTMYGKVAKGAIFDRMNRVAPTLARLNGRTDFTLPHRLTIIDDLNLDVQTELPGRPMADLLADGRGGGLGEAVGTALRSLHRSPLQLPVARSGDEHAALLTDNANQLARFRPSHRSAVLLLRHEIVRRFQRQPTSAMRICHNDFHGGNVLAGSKLGLGSGLGLIDFEDAAMGDPANDVGSMYAHLTELAFRHPDRRPAILAERTGFLAGYDIDDLHHRFATYAAVHFVLLAYQALRYPGEDAEQRIESMLASATTVLAGAQS